MLIPHIVSVVRLIIEHIANKYLGLSVELREANQFEDSFKHLYPQLFMESVQRTGTKLDGATSNTDLPGNRIWPNECYFRKLSPYAGTE